MKQKNVILMVVAVGFGLVAAFLTSTMNGKTAAPETFEVLVAAKDLSGGVLSPEDVKRKALPKGEIGEDLILATEGEPKELPKALVGMRLTRAVRANEPIHKTDLSKGGVITIPEKMIMVTLPLSANQAAAGFAGPGARVDIVTSVRLENSTRAMPLLVNMEILAVNGQTIYPPEGVFPNVSSVSFAANQKQALVLELAKSRGCQMSLLLRNPGQVQSEFEKDYSIEKVHKLLESDKEAATLVVIEPSEGKNGKTPPKAVVAPVTEPKAAPTEAPPPVAVKKTVQVPVAVEYIPAGTPVTKDLLSNPKKFGTLDLPEEFAQNALTMEQLVGRHGQVFRTGLGKDQWVTESLVGSAEAKNSPKDEPSLPKPDVVPSVPRRTHDMTIHTARDVRTYRYEEVEPGRWRFLYEVRPDSKPATETDPRASDKKVD